MFDTNARYSRLYIMTKKLLSIFVIVVVGIAVFLLGRDGDLNKRMAENSPSPDAMVKVVDDSLIRDLSSMKFDYIGELNGVLGNTSSGVASFSWRDGKYTLLATFKDLPDPKGEDFYEGWIIQQSPFKFISTGKAEKTNGIYSNLYISGQDFSNYNQYVLTLEPNDGDPGPAEHIMEGKMKKI